MVENTIEMNRAGPAGSRSILLKLYINVLQESMQINSITIKTVND